MGRWSGKELCLYFLLTCVSVLAFTRYGVNTRASAERIVSGDAQRPFINRQLPARVTKAIAGVISGPETAPPGAPLPDLGEAGKIMALGFQSATDKDFNPRESAAATLIAWPCFFGLALFVATMLRSVGVGAPGSRAAATCAVVISLAVASPFVPRFVYDALALLLTAAGLAAIATGNRPLYWIAYLLFIPTREAALILPFVYAFANWRRDWRLGANLAFQVALWAAFRLVIKRMYPDAGGSVVELWPERNIEFLLTLQYRGLYGFGAIAILGFALYQTREKAAAIFWRPAVWAFVPMVGIYVATCWIEELRSMYEYLVLATVAVASGLVHRAPTAPVGTRTADVP